jgi:hypothetical protein
MVKRFALMESLSANLHDFLKKVSENLSLPDKKFLYDGLVALIRSSKPIVCQMARQLPDQHTAFLSRLDRLEGHLVNGSGFDSEIKQALPQVWLPQFNDDTSIILDLSDLAKPLARKMDYLATVRDGSTGELVNGYWLLEMYASISRHNPVPILLEPFSHQEPCSPGQNPVVLRAIHKIFELTDGRGVLVIDRGFDARVMFEDWLAHRYRFVARLVGKRHLLRFSGNPGQSNCGQWIPILARQLAEQTATAHYFTKAVKRHGKIIFHLSQVGWTKVRLPRRDENLTLVVSRIAGKNTPLMLLTNLPVKNADDARRILRYYLRRWECEEAIRFLKSQVHLEKIRTFRWCAICRLVLLAMLVMIYVGWIIEMHPDLADWLIRFGQPPPRQVDFLLYRLFEGLIQTLDGCFWLRRSLLEIHL